MEKDGKINAEYNAWSFDIKAKFKTERTWVISVKKSTYTNQSILFSQKWLSNQEIIEFRTRIADTDCPDFRIVPSTWKSKLVKHKLCLAVYELIQPIQSRKEPAYAKFKQGELNIKINHKNDNFDLVERIIQIIDSIQ